MGLEIVGDLRSLAAPPAQSGRDLAEANPDLISIDAAVQAVIGSAYSARTPPSPAPVKTAPPANALTSRELASLLSRRVRRRLRRTLRHKGSSRRPTNS
jgi:hypothetical protein